MMAREEAIEMMCAYGVPQDEDKFREALNMAIKALEQKSCEDAVSRKKVLEIVNDTRGSSVFDIVFDSLSGKVEALPSVTPTRKVGKWIKGKTHEKYDYFGDRVRVANYHCSICDRVIEDIGLDDNSFANQLSDYPYCHCGAEMESEE